jgi:hypothetical protein
MSQIASPAKPRNLFEAADVFFRKLVSREEQVSLDVLPLSHSYPLYLPELYKLYDPEYLRNTVQTRFLDQLENMSASGSAASIPESWQNLGSFYCYTNMIQYSIMDEHPETDWSDVRTMTSAIKAFEWSEGRAQALVHFQGVVEVEYRDLLENVNVDDLFTAVEALYQGASLLCHLTEYSAYLDRLGHPSAEVYNELTYFFEVLSDFLLPFDADRVGC